MPLLEYRLNQRQTRQCEQQTEKAIWNAERGTVGLQPEPLILAKETSMQLKRPGSQPSTRDRRVFHGFGAHRHVERSSRSGAVSCASVTFEPGARSAWHTHPLGQTLIVTPLR